MPYTVDFLAHVIDAPRQCPHAECSCPRFSQFIYQLGMYVVVGILSLSIGIFVCRPVYAQQGGACRLQSSDESVIADDTATLLAAPLSVWPSVFQQWRTNGYTKEQIKHRLDPILEQTPIIQHSPAWTKSWVVLYASTGNVFGTERTSSHEPRVTLPIGSLNKKKQNAISYTYKNTAYTDIDHFDAAEGVLEQKRLNKDTAYFSIVLTAFGLDTSLASTPDRAFDAIQEYLLRTGIHTADINTVLQGEYIDPRREEVVEYQSGTIDAKRFSVLEMLSNSIDALRPPSQSIGQRGKGIKPAEKFLTSSGDSIQMKTIRSGESWSEELRKDSAGQTYITSAKEATPPKEFSAYTPLLGASVESGTVMHIHSEQGFTQQFIDDLTRDARKKYPFLRDVALYIDQGDGTPVRVNGYGKKRTLAPSGVGEYQKTESGGRVVILSITRNDISVIDNGAGVVKRTTGPSGETVYGSMSSAIATVFVKERGGKTPTPFTKDRQSEAKKRIRIVFDPTAPREVVFTRRDEAIEHVTLPDDIHTQSLFGEDTTEIPDAGWLGISWLPSSKASSPRATRKGGLQIELDDFLPFGESRQEVRFTPENEGGSLPLLVEGMNSLIDEVLDAQLPEDELLSLVNTIVTGFAELDHGDPLHHEQIRLVMQHAQRRLEPVLSRLRTEGVIFLPHDQGFDAIEISPEQRVMRLHEALIDWREHGEATLARLGGIKIVEPSIVRESLNGPVPWEIVVMPFTDDALRPIRTYDAQLLNRTESDRIPKIYDGKRVILPRQIADDLIELDRTRVQRLALIEAIIRDSTEHADVTIQTLLAMKDIPARGALIDDIQKTSRHDQSAHLSDLVLLEDEYSGFVTLVDLMVKEPTKRLRVDYELSKAELPPEPAFAVHRPTAASEAELTSVTEGPLADNPVTNTYLQDAVSQVVTPPQPAAVSQNDSHTGEEIYVEGVDTDHPWLRVKPPTINILDLVVQIAKEQGINEAEVRTKIEEAQIQTFIIANDDAVRPSYGVRFINWIFSHIVPSKGDMVSAQLGYQKNHSPPEYTVATIQGLHNTYAKYLKQQTPEQALISLQETYNREVYKTAHRIFQGMYPSKRVYSLNPLYNFIQSHETVITYITAALFVAVIGISGVLFPMYFIPILWGTAIVSLATILYIAPAATYATYVVPSFSSSVIPENERAVIFFESVDSPYVVPVQINGVPHTIQLDHAALRTVYGDIAEKEGTDRKEAEEWFDQKISLLPHVPLITNFGTQISHSNVTYIYDPFNYSIKITPLSREKPLVFDSLDDAANTVTKRISDALHVAYEFEKTRNFGSIGLLFVGLIVITVYSLIESRTLFTGIIGPGKRLVSYLSDSLIAILPFGGTPGMLVGAIVVALGVFVGIMSLGIFTSLQSNRMLFRNFIKKIPPTKQGIVESGIRDVLEVHPLLPTGEPAPEVVPSTVTSHVWPEQVLSRRESDIQLARRSYVSFISRIPSALRGLYTERVRGLYETLYHTQQETTLRRFGDQPIDEDVLPVAIFMKRSAQYETVLSAQLERRREQMRSGDQDAWDRYQANLSIGLLSLAVHSELSVDVSTLDPIQLDAIGYGWPVETLQNVQMLPTIGRFLTEYAASAVDRPLVVEEYIQAVEILRSIGAHAGYRDVLAEKLPMLLTGNHDTLMTHLQAFRMGLETAQPDAVTAFLGDPTQLSDLRDARKIIWFLTTTGNMLKDGTTVIPDGEPLFVADQVSGGLAVSQIEQMNREWQKEHPGELIPLDEIARRKRENLIPVIDPQIEFVVLQAILTQGAAGAGNREARQNSGDAGATRMDVSYSRIESDGKVSLRRTIQDDGTGALQPTAVVIRFSTKEAEAQATSLGFFGTGKFEYLIGEEDWQHTDDGTIGYSIRWQKLYAPDGTFLRKQITGIWKRESNGKHGFRIDNVGIGIGDFPELRAKTDEEHWEIYTGAAQASLPIYIDYNGQPQQLRSDFPIVAAEVYDDHSLSASVRTAPDYAPQINDRAGQRVNDLPEVFLRLVPAAFRPYIKELGLWYDFPLPVTHERDAYKGQEEELSRIQRHVAVLTYKALLRRMLEDDTFAIPGVSKDMLTNALYATSYFNPSGLRGAAIAQEINRGELPSEKNMEWLMERIGENDKNTLLGKFLPLLLVDITIDGKTYEDISMARQRHVVLASSKNPLNFLSLLIEVGLRSPYEFGEVTEWRETVRRWDEIKMTLGAKFEAAKDQAFFVALAYLGMILSNFVFFGMSKMSTAVTPIVEESLHKAFPTLPYVDLIAKYGMQAVALFVALLLVTRLFSIKTPQEQMLLDRAQHLSKGVGIWKVVPLRSGLPFAGVALGPVFALNSAAQNHEEKDQVRLIVHELAHRTELQASTWIGKILQLGFGVVLNVSHQPVGRFADAMRYVASVMLYHYRAPNDLMNVNKTLFGVGDR